MGVRWSRLTVLCCRSATPAPLLQSSWPPPGPESQRRTKVPREWRRRRRRRRRRARPGQLLRLRQSGLPGRPPWSQQVPQGVREQLLLLPRDVSASTPDVAAGPASPGSRARHLLPSGVDLDLPRAPPGPPHGWLRHHAAHLTSQRASPTSSSRWSVSVSVCSSNQTSQTGRYLSWHQ